MDVSTSMPCITDAHTKLCTKSALPCTRTDLVFFQSFARAYRQLTHKIFSALRKLIRQVLVVRVAVCLKNGAPAIQSPTMVGVNNNHLITPVWIILSCPKYYQQWLTVRQRNKYICVPYSQTLRTLRARPLAVAAAVGSAVASHDTPPRARPSCSDKTELIADVII